MRSLSYKGIKFKCIMVRYSIQARQFLKMSTQTIKKDGVIVHQASAFRNLITANGASDFPAQSGRYHLYVAYTCPFSTQTLAVRALKGLQSSISMTALCWQNDTIGWVFTDKRPRCGLDTINDKKTLKEIYQLADPDYPSRGAVPVLWDTVTKTLVNNDSSDIIRMLNSEFNEFCATEQQRALDLYPIGSKEKIDQMMQFLEKNVVMGIYKVYHVYKPGSNTNEGTQDQDVVNLYTALDKLESILEENRFLLGNQLTLADIRIFTSLVRFDWVYYGQYKCNKGNVREYPNLWAYTRDIYNLDNVNETIDMDYVERGYKAAMSQVNQDEIIPRGYDLLDFSVPVERRKKFGAA